MQALSSAAAPGRPAPADTALLTPPLRFDAILRPHRSLGPNGFLIVMALIGVTSFIAGLVFFLMGAWPIFGFFGLDVALIYWAFKANYRAAGAYQTVQLSDTELRVRSVSSRGEVRAWSFQPYWVRIEIDAGRHDENHLDLVSHGNRLRIGECLAPFERLDLAAALRAALAQTSPATPAAP